VSISFDKLVPGMRLHDVHSYRMGNTTMSALGCWPVRVISVDSVNRRAMVSWNGNPPESWGERRLRRLYYEDKLPKAYRDQESRRAGKT